MVNDGTAGLLRAKAAGDILPAFPGTVVDKPAFGITTMLQPPAEISSYTRIKATQPVQIPGSAKQLIAAPDGETPFGRSTTDFSIIGDHVIAAILTHAGEIRAWSRLEVSQHDLSSQGRISIAKEEHIHCSFGQYQARGLYLHAIKRMAQHTGRGTYDHAQSLQVIGQATTPACRPVARELRGMTPEFLIVSAMISLCSRNLLNAIEPTLVGLILRDASCQHSINHSLSRAGCISFQSKGKRYNYRTSLPACTFLMLCHVRARNSDIMRPDSGIFKCNDIAHFAKSDWQPIGGACPMNKGIAFAGKAEQSSPLLWSIDSV